MMKNTLRFIRDTVNSINYLLILIILTAIATHVAATPEEPAPREILEKADAARGNVEGIVWEIDIVSMQNSREQHRRLRVTAKNFNSLAEFLAPAKVKGQKMLMRNRNMWFIKPGLRKPVPLSPRQKLLGTASNGDIASTNYAGDYEVSEMIEQRFNGEDCYRFDLQATNKKVTYDRIVYWVSKDRLVGTKADFYTVSGKLFKTATFEYGNHITVDGRQSPFVSRMTITDTVLKNNRTVMSYSAPKTEPVSDAKFNLNLLVR
jgi:hypothetical protein